MWASSVKIKKNLALMGMVFVLALIATLACSSGEPDATVAPATALVPATAPTQAPATTVMKVARVADATDVASLHWPTTGGYRELGGALYSTLVYEDANRNIKPELAISWELGQDQQSYIFKLREDVVFHDGNDFNADEVVQYFFRLMDPDNGAGRRGNFESALVARDSVDPPMVEALDAFTVQFNLKTPMPDFMTLWLDRCIPCIYSSAAFEEFGIDEVGFNPVGTGPYKLERWDRGDKIILTKFEDYYCGYYCQTYGDADLDQWEHWIVPEAGTRLAMVQTLQVDLIRGLGPEDLKVLKDNDKVRTELFPTSIETSIALKIPSDPKTPLYDVRVRQAMNYAVDKEAICRDIYGGLCVPSGGPVNQFLPLARNDLGPWPYDPAKAKELLAEAGFEDGFDLDFATSVRWGGWLEHVTAIQAMFKEVGINMSIATMPMSELVPNFLQTSADKFDVATASEAIYGSVFADYHLRRLWRSNVSDPVGGGDPFRTLTHSTGYRNPEFDALIDEGLTTFEEDKRKQLYDKAQEIVWNDAPHVWLFNKVDALAVNKKLSNIIYLPNDTEVVQALKLEVP